MIPEIDYEELIKAAHARMTYELARPVSSEVSGHQGSLL